MTAHMLEMPAASAVRVRPVRTVRPTSARATVRPAGPAAHRVPAGSAVSCTVRRPAVAADVAAEVRPAPAGERLTWTPRGIAVLVTLVCLCVGIMAATVVGSFLSVSNDPLPTRPASVVVAPAASLAG